MNESFAITTEDEIKMNSKESRGQKSSAERATG